MNTQETTTKDSRIKRFFYKNRPTRKKNKYYFCLVLDADGKMLANALPDVPEFYERISDMSVYASDFLADTRMYENGIHKKLDRFFKVVHPEKFAREFRNTNKESARMPGEKTYLYQDINSALFQSEEFFDGVMWAFGDLSMLSDMRYIIDKIFICRLKHRYEDILPEEELFELSFDEEEFKSYGFIETASYASPASTKFKQLMQTVKESKQEVEYFSEHIKLVTPRSEVKKRAKNVPLIYDYMFQEFEYKRNIDLDAK